ncbi:MAG: glycosyltransferase [Lachnospiraceae bacterium]|nr:glycosyltransferase [Lachnospiraceae bacterium]
MSTESIGNDISVIIPCYNAEKWIDRCMKSIICQTLGIDRIRIICVDDASTDRTLDCLLDWEKRYPANVLVIQCDENRRQGAARNFALDYVDTAYVTYVDADDYLDNKCLEILILVAEKSGAQMVSCEHIRDFSGDLCLSSVFSEKDLQYSETYVKGADSRENEIRFSSVDPQVWGRLLKTDFVRENALFFPEEVTYEDNLWRSMLACCIQHYCKVDLPLYHYFVNNDSTVLTSDSIHHVDFLTVQMKKWDYLVTNGYYERFTDAVEFDFLHNCYLDFLKIICFRYEEAPYPLFCLLQEVVRSRIPQGGNRNVYYENGFTEFQQLLLGFITIDVSRSDFMNMVQLIRRNGI